MSKFIRFSNSYFRKDCINAVEYYAQNAHVNEPEWVLTVSCGTYITSETFGSKEEACRKRCEEILSLLEA